MSIPSQYRIAVNPELVLTYNGKYRSDAEVAECYSRLERLCVTFTKIDRDHIGIKPSLNLDPLVQSLKSALDEGYVPGVGVPTVCNVDGYFVSYGTLNGTYTIRGFNPTMYEQSLSNPFFFERVIE